MGDFNDSFRKAFSTDKDLMKTGVWFEYENMRFRLAYAGVLNPNWLKQLDIVQKPFRRAIELKLVSDEKAEELNLDLFLRATLLDWQHKVVTKVASGDYDEKEVSSWAPGIMLDGNLLSFSQANARKLLTEFPLLWQTLRQDAGDASNFRPGDPETDAKN